MPQPTLLKDSMQTKIATIALVGQPNVGKSTVFNILTGLNQHVGNWPGKTVEQRVGSFAHHGVQINIIDLPGAYCLTAASPEEMITRNYIIHEQPDVVLVVINAASLERNLYLVAELLTLPSPIVIGLNMMDVAEQEGLAIDVDALSKAIGVPVIPMTAARGEGVHRLIDAAMDIIEQGPQLVPNRPQIRADHYEAWTEVHTILDGYVPDPYPSDWVALKILEGDPEITEIMRSKLPKEQWARVETILRQHEDALIAVASGRYEWISQITQSALKRTRPGRVTLTQRLDRIATHPFWGLITLALILATIFGLTYTVGVPVQEWLASSIIGRIGEMVARVLAPGPTWLSSLVVNGVIGGMGTVVTFLPILIIFFAGMGLLEDVGYMARAAYVMDRFMHTIGLHGKSFMPLFLGFGCNVPAIMGTRIIESERNRLLTILLAPLVPCTARLAVLAVLVPAFFPSNATLVSWLLTALPIVMLAIIGVLVKWMMRDEGAALIMEMPLYHQPNWRTIGLLIWERSLAFLKKAGTVILAVSVIIWLLSTLPYGNIETSFLASIGRLLGPIGNLMGLDWKPIVALLASFVAKENAIATLGVLYGVGENPVALQQVLSTGLSVASGLAFLVAEMLFIPCVSTIAVIRQETGSWKWPVLEMLFLTLLAILGGIGAYQIARLVL